MEYINLDILNYIIEKVFVYGALSGFVIALILNITMYAISKVWSLMYKLVRL